MSANFDRPLKIEIRLPSSHPQILLGLDTWLSLGLISDAQVRQICQEFLVCPIVLQPQTQPQAQPQNVETLPHVTPLQQDTPPRVHKPNILTRMLQSLGAELSVRWLLFLGMFLVVVSSGVLAASQWEKFPPVGQYGVLLAYTLSFWGISFWAGRQSNLLLTAQTLLIVTLLLVPVNFWAMDSFRLWQHPSEWIVLAIASVLLTAITFLICSHRQFFANNAIRQFPLINILGLSYLHWGWSVSGFPLIAVYLAMVGTTISTIYYTRYQQRQMTADTSSYQQLGLNINLASAVIIYALVVILIRAIFVVHINIQELGLAIGACGWLLTWLAQQRSTQDLSEVNSPSLKPSLWEFIGAILLLLGWLVSVGVAFPWQATIVSGLGLWFFKGRLQQHNVRTDVGVIFVIGLQTIWLLWRLIPFQWQQWAIATGTSLTHSQNAPWALLSVALFPYGIFMLVLANQLMLMHKVKLADFAEKLTLVFGICLTLVSLANPALRSLNLLFSTITLATISQQRRTSMSLVYMTQIIGVLTLSSTINLFLPHLTEEMWASIVLALAIAEWLLSLGNGLWERSSWHIGLVLTALSYVLLWKSAQLAWLFGASDGRANWGMIWLITPMTLTGIAYLGFRRITNSWLSVVALGLAQLLTLPLSGARLIGLGVATLVMLVNTYYLRQLQSALITIGFGLGLIAALLWEGVPNLPHLSIQGWFLVGAIASISLWLMQTFLRRQTHELTSIYTVACDKWAIALCSIELLLLSVHSLEVYRGLAHPGSLYLISELITLGAIIYRSSQQLTNWGFYGIGWCLELLIAEALGFGGHSIIKVAIANIALGLITQLLGEWWRHVHQHERLPNSLHILPLIYGVFGTVLRWHTFANWTGLSTAGVSLIAIGVGRRRPEFKPLVYLGIIGISIAAYELLLYQILQTSEGGFSDGLIAMSALGTSIMYAYRILSPWLLDYLRLTKRELEIFAHIHWAVSSCLLVAASSTSTNLKMVGLATGLFLVRYAIFQGRVPQSQLLSQNQQRVSTPEIWVYLGLLEIICLWRFLPDSILRLLEENLLSWQVAIASVIACLIYILPWETWGWSKRPWQRAALILPLAFLWQTRSEVLPINLLIAAGFYVFVAKAAEQFRFIYISLALCNWALFQWFYDLHLTDSLWYVTPIGLSVLLIAQLDPDLKRQHTRGRRHLLRLLGTSIICGWATVSHQEMIALIPGIFSLIAIFAGLALRVRAFLYVGLVTFFTNSFYQLVVLSLHYPFFKWIVGLAVGIILISVAANFETRRQKLNSLLRSTSDELQSWE